MLNEIKIFFNSIKHFRHLLNEAVGQSTIVDAINKRKIVYIYYAGDNTVMRGYRTIKPFVLGTSTKDGGLLLRAWEEAGASDSKKRYADPKGRMKYGWRLFRVDGITSFLPTGRHFSAKDDKIPSGYNPDDSQMASIIAAVKPVSITGRVDTKGMDSFDDPDMVKQKIEDPDSVFKNQAEKFRYFADAAKKTREATKEEIESLYDIATRVRKKAPSKLLVVQDEHGDMVLKDIGIKDKLPPESIVGNLKDLYNKLVVDVRPIPKTFFDNTKEKTKREVEREK